MKQSAKSEFIDSFILLRYVCYPAARILSKLLSRTRVHPIHITLIWYALMFIGFALGLSGSSALTVTIIFAFAYFLDCLDGQYARDTGLTSLTGKVLDDFGADIFFTIFWIAYASAVPSETIFGVSTLQLGVSISLISLLRGSLANRAEKASESQGNSTASPPASSKPSFRRYLLRNVYGGFGGFLLPCLFLSVAFGFEIELLLVAFWIQMGLISYTALSSFKIVKQG